MSSCQFWRMNSLFSSYWIQINTAEVSCVKTLAVCKFSFLHLPQLKIYDQMPIPTEAVGGRDVLYWTCTSLKVTIMENTWYNLVKNTAFKFTSPFPSSRTCLEHSVLLFWFTFPCPFHKDQLDRGDNIHQESAFNTLFFFFLLCRCGERKRLFRRNATKYWIAIFFNLPALYFLFALLVVSIACALCWRTSSDIRT